MKFLRIIPGFMLLVIGMLVLTLCCGLSEGKVITVDDDGDADFLTIQDAINASSDGDEIRVWEGIYYENVEVNKGVTLIGNGTGNTTIDADYEGDVVTISHDDVLITGFQIRRSSDDHFQPNSGILIEADNAQIFNNYFLDNLYSIKVEKTSKNCIIENNTSENHGAYGIHINKYCENVLVIRNILISDTPGAGIRTSSTKNHQIINNSISQHYRGIALDGSENITVRGNELTDNDQGISIMESFECKILKNVISNNNEYGIWLYDTSENSIMNNTCIGNQIGIQLRGNSFNNTIHFNNIFNNDDYGVKADENDGIVVNAENNWWGYASGPYHATNNSDGEGNEVTDYVDFDPWSNGPITEKPVAYIDSISPVPGVEGDSVSFSGHGTDDGTVTDYEWRSDLDGILSTSTSFDAVLSVGTHTISFRVKDDYDVWSDDASQFYEVRPRPVATIDSIDPNPALEFEMVSLSGSGTGGTIKGYNWRSNKDGQLSTEQSFSSDTLSWGIHTISFKVMNDEDIWSYETTAQLFVHRPPRATIESIEPMIALVGEEVTFNGYGNDDSGVDRMVWESSIDGVLKDGMDYFFTLTNLSAGNHTISLRVRDEFGVWGELNESFVIIHQRPQAIIDSIVPADAVEQTERQFTGHGEDDNAITQYSWRSDLDGILGDQAEFSLSHLSNGTHAISFRVMDEYGTWSDEVSATITVNGIPRAEIISIEPEFAPQGTTVEFTCTGSDDGSITDYAWRSDLDGDLSPDTSFSTNSLSNGTHTIFLKVMDDKGIWSGEVSAQIIVNGIPTARIDSVSNSTAYAGDPITFHGNGTDDDGLSRFVWTSDLDGELFNGSLSFFTISNLSIGDHTITLRVQDTHGVWSEQVTVGVTILELPDDSTPPTITIATPKNGATVSGNVTFSGTAYDETRLSKIEFRMHGASEWSQTQTKTDWSFTMDTADLEDGEYTMEFRAFDGVQYSDIATVTFTVDNAGGGGPGEEEGDDDSILMKEIGPLPLIGYVGLLVVVLVLVLAIGKRGGKKTQPSSDSDATSGLMPGRCACVGSRMSSPMSMRSGRIALTSPQL